MTTKAKKTADQPSNDEIFDQSAAPDQPTPTEAALNAEHDNDPANKPIDAAFDKAIDAPPTPGAIDFAALRQREADRKRIEADAAQYGGNVPVDVNTGAEVTSGFFMDLTKDDEFELIPAGTRLVVSCTAADAVISGNGNPMINVRVKSERVVNAADMSRAAMWRNRSVKDRLMFIPPNETTGSRGTIWRTKLAFKAFGVEWNPRAFRTQADFMEWAKEKAELMIGSVCEIIVGVDDGTQGGTKKAQLDPQTGEPYPPKNTIAQYYPFNPAPAPSASTEDLPF